MGAVGEGDFAPLAADRHVAIDRVFGIWRLPLIELSAHATLRMVRNIRFHYRSHRGLIHVSLARRTLVAPSDTTPSTKVEGSLTVLAG